MRQVVNYKLSGEQYRTLHNLCEEILETSVEKAHLIYWTVFGVEPSYSDMQDFRLVLEVIKAEKTGNPLPDGMTVYKVDKGADGK